MKPFFRIGGAFILGIFIVVGALYSRDTSVGNADEIIVARAPQRTYIEESDGDSDGIRDWEEDLYPRAIEIPRPEITGDEEVLGTYTKPTTLTGKFSQAFLKDFLTGKMRGEDMGDPTSLVGSALLAIEKNTASVRHTRLDFPIVATTEDTSFDYGNRIAEAITKHSINNENEMLILDRAYKEDDPEILKELDPIYDAYSKIIEDTLNIPTPDALINEHVNLLNSYEAIRTDIDAMRFGFSDPLLTLSRIRHYEGDATELAHELKNILASLNETGVVYTKEDSGAFLYLFDI